MATPKGASYMTSLKLPRSLSSSFSLSSFAVQSLLALTCLFSILALTSILSAKRRRRRNPRKLPLPPGPKRLPVLGNVLQLPQEHPWLVYNEWAKTYGDIIYLEAMGQPLLVLGSSSPALELLDTRARNYSDRPSVPMLDLMDVGWSFSLMPYASDWRVHRRTFHQFLGPNVVEKYHPIQEQETLTFLRRLLDDPSDFLVHTRYLFGSVMMRISYGVEDFEYNKVLIHDAETLIQGFARAATPGKYWVNVFPILRHIPPWLPGAGFRRDGAYLASVSRKVLAEPFDDAKEGMRNGSKVGLPSIATSLIETLPDENHPTRPAQERIARNIAALSYVAGADTTIAAATALLLALAMYPDVQRKAQAELDSVIGMDANRLPKLSDRAQLPYICAIIKEVGRWHTVAPLGGVPHVSTEDDEYKGYFIPKGTYIFVNIWAIMHDPALFEEPMEFKPERFLKDGKLDPSVVDPEATIFGYGRRICPGRYLSNDSLFLMAAALISVFNVSPAKDEAGNPIPLKLEVLSQAVLSPLPFKCDITPRSPGHVGLLEP